VVAGLVGNARGALADFASDDLDLPSREDDHFADCSKRGRGPQRGRGRHGRRENRRGRDEKGCRRPRHSRTRRPS
jgi:hypothetical protein